MTEEMTQRKRDLLTRLRASGKVNQIGDETVPEWREAFELYKESGGGAVDMGCSSCWNKVREWILNEND